MNQEVNQEDVGSVRAPTVPVRESPKQPTLKINRPLSFREGALLLLSAALSALLGSRTLGALGAHSVGAVGIGGLVLGALLVLLALHELKARSKKPARRPRLGRSRARLRSWTREWCVNTVTLSMNGV